MMQGETTESAEAPATETVPATVATQRVVRNIVGRIVAPLALAGYFLGLTDEF